jgi:hypothetical protein
MSAVNPAVLVEVLNDSTERDDRGAKFWRSSRPSARPSTCARCTKRPPNPDRDASARHRPRGLRFSACGYYGPRMGSMWRRWAHLVVLALVLPLALSSVPAFARVLSEAAPHVCECGMRAGHCGCPICNQAAADRRVKDLSIRGRCGADDLVASAALGAAVLPPPALTIAAPGVSGRALTPVPLRLAQVFLMPSTPPPRFALS